MDDNRNDSEKMRRLRAMLKEDLDSSEEADAHLSVVQQLQRWSPPNVSAKELNLLIERLVPEMPIVQPRLSRWWPLMVLRSQMRVVRSEIWVVSALVMTLGAIVTLVTYDPNSTNLTPIAIVAPLVAAIGVALLYDAEVEQMLELEDATLTSARFLLLARLTLVFGCDLILALLASVLLALFSSEISLWPLVMSWLAPMTFLSALAFFLSVILVDTAAGVLFSLAIWALHILMRSSSNGSDLIKLLSLPGLMSTETRPLLFTTALLLVVVALWLVGRTERKIGDIL